MLATVVPVGRGVMTQSTASCDLRVGGVSRTSWSSACALIRGQQLWHGGGGGGRWGGLMFSIYYM